MNTQLLSIEENAAQVYEKAGAVLKNGGLVAFPTETVYGLGANALNAEAAAKIYEAKGRPSDNPLIVHIADIDALPEIASIITEKAKKLCDTFWPGPLTMIFPKTDVVPLGTTGGLDTVAVRMPNHPVALELIKAGGGYIAAPSANTSGRPSPTKANHVLEDLSGRIEMIIDGGDVGIGLESTIIDMSVEPPMILRPGYITKEMLEEVIGEVAVDKTILEHTDTTEKPKAPGMKYKHYAPKGELFIVEGTPDTVIAHINKLTSDQLKSGHTVGIIATTETMAFYPKGVIEIIGSRNDELSIARNLYDVLRKFDEAGVEFIYSESFYTPHIGQAIMNRLLKAAAHRIIQVD